MVTFWSLDLTSPLAGVLVYLTGSILILLFYFKVIPWMDRNDHWKMRMYIEGSIVVIVVTDVLSILVYPPMWKVGFWDAVFVFRQIPNGAHASSYVMVLLLILFACLKFDDALKGIIYGGRMVFLHEGLWFPFYYASNWGSLNIPLDAAFFVWISVMEVIARRRYHLKFPRWLVPVWVVFLSVWFFAWFPHLFPVTVKNVSREFFKTQWYGNFDVEATEVTGWMVFFIAGLQGLFTSMNGKGWLLLRNWKESMNLNKKAKTLSAESGMNRHTKRWQSSVSVILIVSLCVMFLTFSSYPLPSAYATGSVVQWRGSTGVCTTVCSATLSAGVGAQDVQKGNTLVVFIEGNTGANPCGGVTSVTDSFGGDSFSQLTGSCANVSPFMGEWTYGVVLTSSGADTVSASLGGVWQANGMTMQIVELTGTPSFNSLGSFGSSSSSTNANTFDSVILPTSYFLISAIVTGTSGCSTAQGGQTQLLTSGGANCAFVPGAAIGSTSVGWAKEPSGTSPTSFQWTAAQVTWFLNGVVFAQSGVVSSTVVVPPSILSLNYWLFPILFLGLYNGFFLGEGMIAKVSTKGLTYILIGGFVIGSLLAVLMGMISFELPLFTLVGYFVYLFRIKS